MLNNNFSHLKFKIITTKFQFYSNHKLSISPKLKIQFAFQKLHTFSHGLRSFSSEIRHPTLEHRLQDLTSRTLEMAKNARPVLAFLACVVYQMLIHRMHVTSENNLNAHPFALKAMLVATRQKCLKDTGTARSAEPFKRDTTSMTRGN